MLGCRFSVLTQLPYFDPIRMLIIDPMHNLFLGTAKRMINIWIDNNMISKEHFNNIQLYVNNTHVPSDIGRILHKIETGFHPSQQIS